MYKQVSKGILTVLLPTFVLEQSLQFRFLLLAFKGFSAIITTITCKYSPESDGDCQKAGSAAVSAKLFEPSENSLHTSYAPLIDQIHKLTHARLRSCL